MSRFSDDFKEGIDAREKLLSQRLEKEIRYLKKWEKIRTRKWRYVFLHGIVFLALPASLGAYLWNLDFSFAQFNPLEYATHLLTSSLIFSTWAYFNFKAQDRRYHELRREGRL